MNTDNQSSFHCLKEQLRHKRKFNFVTFNTKAASWKDRLVDVSERSLQSAWSWIQNLSCWGSTNTYGAIQLAMSDPQTQAIYLLTDGRPDQVQYSESKIVHNFLLFILICRIIPILCIILF